MKRALLLPRVAATLFGVFGATGLVLSTVGLFGLMSYTVRRRTREVGIRLALGAAPGRVLRLMSLQRLVITGAGLVLGGALAFGVSRVLASFLFGVDASIRRDAASDARCGASGNSASSMACGSCQPTRRASL